MSLVDSLLPVVDIGESLCGIFGLRPISVTRRIRSWSGARIGLGTATTTDTPITNKGGQPPYVRSLSTKDVIASGGLYSLDMYEVGPVVPTYIGGGTAKQTLDPPTTSNPQEVFYNLSGKMFAVGGEWFELVSTRTDDPFGYYMVLKKTAQSP